jgi:hypothetical protein
MGKNKQIAKILKNKAIKGKNKEPKDTKYKFEIYDFSPCQMHIPKKYYTAKMRYKPEVSYLDEGDIIIIDPTATKVRESGIYAFEYKGFVMVRQFQVFPWGYKHVEGKVAYRSVSSTVEEIYPHDEVNIIGAVISKQVELFHGLYYRYPSGGDYTVY